MADNLVDASGLGPRGMRADMIRLCRTASGEPYRPTRDEVRRYVRESTPQQRFVAANKLLARLVYLRERHPLRNALWERFLECCESLSPDEIRGFLDRWGLNRARSATRRSRCLGSWAVGRLIPPGRTA